MEIMCNRVHVHHAHAMHAYDVRYTLVLMKHNCTELTHTCPNYKPSAMHVCTGNYVDMYLIMQELSSELKFSCDEGSNWNTYVFNADNMIVFGVITEPGEHTTVVR